jgi:hypothetical protein
MIKELRIVHLGPPLYAALGAVLGAAATGFVISNHAGLNAVVIGTLAGAIAGAVGGESLGLLIAKLRRRGQPVDRAPSFSWHVDPLELSFSDECDSDIGQSRVAWARATLAARDAWERAARESRKRVALGDPPPRTSNDT